MASPIHNFLTLKNNIMKINESLDIELDHEHAVLWITMGSQNELHYSHQTVSNFQTANLKWKREK